MTDVEDVDVRPLGFHADDPIEELKEELSDSDKAVSDSDTPKLEEEKGLAHQVRGPSSEALEEDCKQSKIEAAEQCDEGEDESVPAESNGFAVDEQGFEDILGSGDLLKKTVEEGTGERPCARQWVTVKISSPTNLEDNIASLTYPLGLHWVIDAWELVIQTMKVGEMCFVKSAARFAYGEAGHGLRVPPNFPQEYMIRLYEVGAVMDLDQMDDKDVEDLFNDMMNRACYFYKYRHYDRAAMLNSGVINMIDKELVERDFTTSKVKALCNLSFCHEQLKDFAVSLTYVNDALMLDPGNLKLKAQKARISMAKKEYRVAVKIFKELVNHEDSDIEIVRDDLVNAEALLKQQIEEEKLVYKRMLGALGKPAPKTKKPLPPVNETNNTKFLVLASLVLAIAIGLYYLGPSLVLRR